MSRTVSYLLEVHVAHGKAEANHVCDDMVKQYPGDVEASGVGKHRAFIRYRVKDDAAAIAIAKEMFPEEDDVAYRLSTGYGMHWRLVREQRYWRS